MEIAIPFLALGGLYLISNQNSKKNDIFNLEEGFENDKLQLPNENIPDKNYPEEYPVNVPELDRTSFLSVNHRYDGGKAYTDKYFNPLNPVNQVSTDKVSDPGIRGKLTTGALSGDSERYSGQYDKDTTFYNITGQKVSSEYFTHNNMVPFFGSKLRSQISDVNYSENVLDNMVGSGSQVYSKKEQSPLFSPHDNLQWATGTPNQTDFIKSRINPSTKMNGVKPFPDEKVGPGLGLGYTTEGLGGYNSGLFMRDSWMDRGVDELRSANKPKPGGISLLGHEGPADSAIKKTTEYKQIGVLEKNRPDTFFEMGQDRYFTTKGAESAPTLRSLPVENFSHRGVNDMTYGGAAANPTQSTYISGEYMPSNNIELGALPFLGASASNKGHAFEEDYGMKTQTSYMNNRTLDSKNSEYYGIIGGSIGAVVAPLLDALRPSRRENTVGTLRPYQNPKSTVERSYMFNPNDRLPPTIRETTENSNGHHLFVNSNQNGYGYVVTENQAADTNRKTTGDYYYAGGSSAGGQYQRPRTYDAEYNQRNNDIKSSTIEGYMVSGNMDLFNSDINMTSKPKEKYLENNRDASVQSTISQTPDIANIGVLQGTPGLYQNIQLDRNSPEILTSLKSNPFILSVLNGI
jgi:hypothetical protein